jgi:dipeptidyl-peptidase 4
MIDTIALARRFWDDSPGVCSGGRESTRPRDRTMRLGVFLWVFALTSPALLADDSLLTVAEKSGFKATARYAEVVELCHKLADKSKLIHLTELGKTGEGRSIPMMIVANPPVSSPEDAAKSGKLVALLLGDIHAGEVCGKEALPILVREILETPGHPLLKDYVLLVAPIFNADGNERINKNNRPGQVGPDEGTGDRVNATGLDLNRDFVKLDAPETRALVRAFNRWDPHLFIDCHTTNGSYHRYTLTYEGPLNPATDAKIRSFAKETMFPEITRVFKLETGRDSFYYGNFDRNHGKWTTYGARPRFGTTYFGLRNRIGILSEAYAYAPYKERIFATRDFVKECLEFNANHKDELLRLFEEARRATIAAGATSDDDDKVPIRSEAKPYPELVTILGFVETDKNGRHIATEEHKDYRVSLEHDFQPSESVRRPYAYIFPAKYTAAIENLQRHGLDVAELREDVELDLEVYRIAGINREPRPFQGHRETSLFTTLREDTLKIEAGSIVVKTAHSLGTLAVYLLEPRSDDSLATWNYFDDGLETGTDFPVLRLPNPTPLLTSPVRPLPEDRKSGRPITVADVRNSASRSNYAGSQGGEWIDGERLLQYRDGRLMVVEATTGRASPYYDPEAMARGLAGLQEVGAAAASLARRSKFEMDPDRKGALFEQGGDLYYASFDGKTAIRLTKTPGIEEMPTFSPDGHFVAFIRNNDLFVVDLETQTERPLTRGGTEIVRNGKADWVYFEELFNRSWKAFWWSPDSKRLAFLQLDDRPVRKHAVLNELEGRREVEETPYPRAGEANPRVRLGSLSIDGGSVTWADLGSYPSDAMLISHVGWFPDSRSTLAYVQNRTQTWLDVLKISTSDGKATKLFRETTNAWVESLGDPRFLRDGSFLLRSERDGWKHLYLFNADGSLRLQLTKGDWEVKEIDLVDEKAGWIYFTASRDAPLGNNLYRVKLDGGSIERLTLEAGDHQAEVSPDGRYFVDNWSSTNSPPHSVLHATNGRRLRTIDNGVSHSLDEFRVAPRERLRITARDGFPLEAELITPPDLDPKKSYPVWFSTYAGPHYPTVSDGWAGGRMLDQALAADGFVVFRMDPRSASTQGAKSTWTAYKRLGVKELEDITDAIHWLKKKPYVDGSRIGMSGHSYGGYITAYAMTHSDLFAAGIAGAPVTDWNDYDSIYTERYMLTPQENPSGYAASSVVAAAGNLHGRLLILHGLMDDNVSIRNTMRLVHALQQADKDFELMIYPPARHGIFGPHYQRQMLDFMRRLGGPRDRLRSTEE